jgi:hypothetical protein
MIELTPTTLAQSVVMGLIATVAIDVWAVILKRGVGLPVADWALVGRWFGHLARGTVAHPAIARAPRIRHELALGWTAHYLIGVVYGLAYVTLVAVRSGAPSLASACLFGLITLVAPWLILQPGMGAGVFARRAPRPGMTRGVNFSVHLLFGTALYLAWLLVSGGAR